MMTPESIRAVGEPGSICAVVTERRDALMSAQASGEAHMMEIKE